MPSSRSGLAGASPELRPWSVAVRPVTVDCSAALDVDRSAATTVAGERLPGLAT
ncbi:hypothetical protein ABIE67_007777 [Streptomyces sp. V4I8]|uniref:hypothetical protein n=1 Tax=Streptomyces sp. V4I8 TaxID=3156469 RepID=UPI003518E9E9